MWYFWLSIMEDHKYIAPCQILQKSDRRQIFLWSSQTSSRIGYLFFFSWFAVSMLLVSYMYESYVTTPRTPWMPLWTPKHAPWPSGTPLAPPGPLDPLDDPLDPILGLVWSSLHTFELVCQADMHFIYICIFASLLPGSWSWDSCKSGRTAWPCTRLGTPEERQAGKIIAKIKKIDDKLPFFSFFLDCSSHHKLRKTCHIECCPKKQEGQRYMEVSYV